jgi:hypothetical protein
VRSLCDRVLYLVNGKKQFEGDAGEGTRRYETDLVSRGIEAGSTGGGSGFRPDSDTIVEETAILHDASDEGVVIAPGDPFEVRVRYRNRRELERAPVLSVTFLRGDGVTCAVLNSREAGFNLARTEGAHAVVARFESVPLYPSKFSVEVLIWDAEMLVVLDERSVGGVEVRFEERTKINRFGVFIPEGSFRAETP